MFEQVKAGPKDPMFDLKKRADGDTSAAKVDLGVGIYRSPQGLYQELDVVRRAKGVLSANDPGHDYEITVGNETFLRNATSIVFGKDCPRVSASENASVQTISGTGAVHLAALLLSSALSPLPKVYVGTPAWGNYEPMFQLVGLEVVTYPYFDPLERTVDISCILRAIHDAPPASVFVLQACCHNPTGADPTQKQWDQIATAMKEGGHVPLFDIAYQGLGNGFDEDAYAVRHFAAMGFEMLVCQSFSKNLALYGERCGALHVVSSSSEEALAVRDRLRCLIRWEFSSSPAFGSRLANIISADKTLVADWQIELSLMRTRLKDLRQTLYKLLTELKTPGDWSHIVRETGLFSFLQLTSAQCQTLVNDHHIYLPNSGRINISGLNAANIHKVAKAINLVVAAHGSAKSGAAFGVTKEASGFTQPLDSRLASVA